MNRTFAILFAAVALSSCNSGRIKHSTVDSVHSANNDTSTNWKTLFDGKTTKGWHTYGQDTVGSAWKAENGVLHLDASKKNDWQTLGGGDIVTDEEFENFDLKLEWKISPAGNSGIMFYIKEDSRYEYPWYTGPEMQVADNQKNEDGKLKKHRAGELYDLLSLTKDAVKPAGEWNQVEVVSNKGKLDFYMNNEHVLSTTMWDDSWKKLIQNSKFKDMPDFGSFKKGKIGLQDHGADVWYRNIQIKRL
ncbi:3-keto-disaccharide hydrolase [Rubrolithibacter danxiaensis]|uniref:3-keto-disaccharide hydrolase n=1 Tax=Rubrolithibacter danxiaensis TaxID=3390805 RepID=UPI003BF7C653